MSRNQGGKHFAKDGAQKSVPANRRGGGKVGKVIIILLSLLGILVLVGLIGKGLNSPWRYRALEDFYNDPSTGFAEGIQNASEEAGIDLDEYFAVDYTVRGNTITGTFTLVDNPSPLLRHSIWWVLRSEEVGRMAGLAIARMESDLSDAGIELSSDVQLCVVLLDPTGNHIASGTFSRDGLVDFEGEDVSLTLEEIWRDDLVSKERSQLEEQFSVDAGGIEDAGPCNWVGVEAHGNELEFVIEYDTDSYDINGEAIAVELHNNEELVSSMSDGVLEMENRLRDYGITIDVTWRIAYRDAQGNTIASCAYSKSGIVEG